MSGAKHRQKGNRVEREIVNLHLSIGVHAERVPLSGAARYQDNGADVDIYAFGVDECPLVSEVKGRKSGDGFRMLERWLGENDVLFLRANRREPLAVLPWRAYVRLLTAIMRWQRGGSWPKLEEILRERAVRAEEGGSDGIPQTTEAPHSPRKAKTVLTDGNEGRPPDRVAARKARA